MDPTIFYNQEEQLGRRRKNRELIEMSSNVVEFEPFLLSHIYESKGEKGLFIAYNHYLDHGYEEIKGIVSEPIKTDKDGV